MSYKKGAALYEGKAKKLFEVEGHPELVWMEFKDSLTAFNAQKKGSFTGKGLLNRNLASFIFRYLVREGVGSHWRQDMGERDMVCERVAIIPLEVVVRNRLAGSTAKKFNIEEGLVLEQPLVEFYFKDDALNDPFLSDDQALMMKAAKSQAELEELKKRGLKVNAALKRMFFEMGIDLVDFKIEFGRTKSGDIVLADEITPDSCRLWDLKTGEKLDKDRFRRDLGRVEESYQEVWERMQTRWGADV